VSVREIDNLRVRAIVPIPTGAIRRLAIDDAGTILAVSLIDVDRRTDVLCLDVASGRELLRVQNCLVFRLSPDGRSLVTQIWEEPGFGNVTVWDVQAGRTRIVPEPPSGASSRGFEAILSPDGKTVGIPVVRTASNPIEDLAKRLGLPWPRAIETGRLSCGLFDMATGESRGIITGRVSSDCWTSDSRLFATTDRDRTTVFVWDIPPRKPLTWFAAAAAFLALAVLIPARWRTRRLAACLTGAAVRRNLAMGSVTQP
jgi:hypothetical protein